MRRVSLPVCISLCLTVPHVSLCLTVSTQKAAPPLYRRDNLGTGGEGLWEAAARHYEADGKAENRDCTCAQAPVVREHLLQRLRDAQINSYESKQRDPGKNLLLKKEKLTTADMWKMIRSN